MRAPNHLVPALCFLPLLASLLACGGPAPELALEGPSSLALAWGGSEAVELTLERNKTATGDLTLSVEGLPAGVTARFAPDTVAGDALSATLHLEAARDAAAVSALVTIRATGADALVAEHVFLLEVSGLTVTGTIESILGEKVPVGTAVKVGSQWVATDGEGAFVVHNVAVPYDLAIKGASVTEVYLGLTSPTLQVKGFLDDYAETEWLHVDIDLTIVPTPMPNEVVEVCTSGVHPTLSDCKRLQGNGVSNTLAMSVNLHGGPSVSRQLVARRTVVDQDGLTTGYTGHGAAAVPLRTRPERGV